MADNTQLNSNDTTGDLLATKAVTHGGDSAKLQAVSLMGVSGTEGSYTIADINGDAANGLDVDVTRVGGNVTVVQATAANLNATVTVGAALPAGNSIVGQVKITDGTDVADVLDLSSSNPLAVAIVDTNGDQIASFGGGTQYTEDAAAAANPVGTALNLIRADALAGLTTTDGDNVAARGTDKGELYVKHVDAIPITDNSGSLTVDGTVAVSSITTAVVPGTGATNLGKAEDAAHSSGDVGVMSLTVRQDTAAALGGTDADYQPLITDASGRLHVNVGNTVTVGSHAVTNAGTFAVQAAQSGTWTVQPGNTANTTAWKVDASSVAVPITDNSGSLTVDNGGTFAVQATIAAGATSIAKVEDVASADADVGIPAMAVRKATPANTSGTDGDYEMLQMSAGRLWVDPSGVTLTVAAHAVTNAGTFAVQVDGAALTSLQLIDDPVIADDAAFTPATSKVMMAGYQADEASTDSVDEGDAGAARMTLDRKLIVTPQPHAAGGLSIYRSIDLDEGTLEVVKNSPGTIYGMWITNTSTATRWVKFYDATSGTAGTGTPVITIGIPGNASDDIAGNFGPGGMGIAFATGICFGATTGVADNDTGAPGANDVIANVFYK